MMSIRSHHALPFLNFYVYKQEVPITRLLIIILIIAIYLQVHDLWSSRKGFCCICISSYHWIAHMLLYRILLFSKSGNRILLNKLQDVSISMVSQILRIVFIKDYSHIVLWTAFKDDCLSDNLSLSVSLNEHE